MRTLSLQASVESLLDTADRIKEIAPQFVFLACGRRWMADPDLFRRLAESLPDAAIVGCSTSGEIGVDGVSDKGFTIAAAHFDHSRVRTASLILPPDSDARTAGEAVARELLADDLKGIFVISPGVRVNGSELVEGLRKAVPPHVTLSGGLAGDGMNFQATATVLNGDMHSNRLIATGFYGDRLKIGTASRGGWKPFGPARRVTKSVGNVLYELDGKPALELYKSYLGEKASGLPATGMTYPLALMRDNRTGTGLIRSVLDVDHKSNTLIVGGDIPPHSLVCLMHASPGLLSQGAVEAARMAAQSAEDREGDALNILISCVGRRAVMGEDVDDEIEAALEVFDDRSTSCGFYSYGEICFFDETRKVELHNQTMTITHIHETKAR